ncbi:MAG: hypothetical protein GX614_08835, partial [Sandaracinaceae bacterium]|nr:hypothetical protein [Sandaracinaceae bacterium]
MSARIIEGRILGSSKEALFVHDGERLLQLRMPAPLEERRSDELGLGDLVRIEADERGEALVY